MRTLVIGDIHGAAKALEQVLERAGKADRYIFLGDYVDGYPETPRVITLLDELSQQKGVECIFLRGNHDQWAIDWITGMYAESKDRELRGEPIDPNAYRKKPDDNHYDQGGKATYDAYMAIEPEGYMMLKLGFDAGWLSKTVMHFLDERNRLFVHGGVDGRGVGSPDMIKMWNRDLMEGAYRLRKHDVGHESVPDVYRKFQEIYVGHTAAKSFTDKEEPAHWLNLWAMDTNCGWGGPLCAMDIDTKELFYSDPARDLYPGYKGR